VKKYFNQQVLATKRAYYGYQDEEGKHERYIKDGK
jgi:hypothetical protein